MSPKNKFWIIFLFTISLTSILSAQNKEKKTKLYKPEIINPALPDTVYESSALLWHRNKLWTLNDGGNAPCIYGLDQEAKKIQQIICIKDLKNADWEALASDEKHFYIGDIGNNKGQRNNFSIYKFRNDFTENTNLISDPEVIRFSYKNYRSPKFKTYSQWDAEAIVCIRDTIVLFNKNWQEPNCYIYVMPAKAGNYELKPWKRLSIDGLITDASYNPGSKSLILIGYKDFIPFVYHFQNFDLQHISLRKAKRYDFQSMIGVQVEGITFMNDSVVYFTSEYNPATKGALYRMYIEK